MKAELVKRYDDGKSKTTVMYYKVPSDPFEWTFGSQWSVKMSKDNGEGETVLFEKTYRTRMQAVKTWRDLCMELLWED